MQQVIIISAINLRSGGTLTILRDCLRYLSSSPISKKYRIIALVHKQELANYPNIEYLEYPKSVNNWFRRLYYEYFHFNKLSKKLNPILWLSLHDTSPRVKAKYQAVYMHNPSIVNRIRIRDLRYDKTYVIFSLFYRYIYKLNIHSNNYCIVQQNWLRESFSEKLNINKDRIIVARPNNSTSFLQNNKSTKKKCRKFFFPSFPRPFKNFETVCEAAKILYEDGLYDIQIKLTIDGTESKYSRDIVKKYNAIPIIIFCGLLSKAEVQKSYDSADCLIFPSRLETWGLPISEFIPQRKPMIVANLKYSHETTQGADTVCFFDVNSPNHLAHCIKEAYLGDFSSFSAVQIDNPSQPFAANYKELFEILLEK